LINEEKNEFEVEKFRFFALGDPRYPKDTRLRDFLFHNIKASTHTFNLRPKRAKLTWTFFRYSHLKLATRGTPTKENLCFTSKSYPILMKLSDIT
jgi:hypothetical protein